MVNLPIKRSREEEFDSLTSMANCLMLLSGGGRGDKNNIAEQTSQTAGGGGGRVFECKTCSRQFPSFQALGGHRASHKRPRTAAMVELPPSSPPKPKTHECSICGQEFGIGQALGGHMRRHRAVVMNSEMSSSPPPDRVAAVVKIPAGGRRVLCLDLNLTPLENDLEFFKLGKMGIQGS
ncbi:PREDICTED: zinc finger protein ZAT12-like [Ipomoea nil]|uniref:zinc finger protein ZAT12-like n=1 Tax=Ipomoea nil TaxID=35883 RepID=UPI0009010F3C|nr:PREDICTED: zinc finger protein ZAT12-like [Ipomoea nil]XP_019192744.1 PREDICTED: zinc finger protein ZAT12-like [Ipomoea nil]XP_019192745.1 PREDICTED: zinc finger protein ZAT12-like [Ipomoea nil]XP_019192746.1 PREDICTED: zinc finger protein ZAT12-like [Ipomoea nil]XP_019192747.1 PREDICTED: zinc finger protein ZAT12-like [Ipomoea nil]